MPFTFVRLMALGKLVQNQEYGALQLGPRLPQLPRRQLLVPLKFLTQQLHFFLLPGVLGPLGLTQSA
jgi:hypothetical protein